MNTSHATAIEYLQNSQKAYEQGDLAQARRWAQQAVRLEPHSEDAWLWMGAIASPRASVGYLERALEINPASTRARQGLAWARKRISAGQMAETRPHKVQRVVRPYPVSVPPPAAPPQKPKSRTRLNLSSVLIGLMVLCLAVGLIALLNTSSARAFLRGQGTPVAAQPWASVQIDEASATVPPAPAATV